MISKEVAAALTFEGICPAGDATPIYFGTRYGARIRFFLGAGNETLAALPRSVETSVDPISSRYDVSSFSFELKLTDDVAATFLRQGWIEVASLTAPISASATTIPMSREIDEVSGGAPLYLEDETILVGTWDAGLSAYVDCVRGAGFSAAVAHQSGVNVYDLPPYWSKRGVTLWTLDADDLTIANSASPPWRRRWQGSLEDINTAENGTRIQLDCTEALSGLLGTTIYDAPIDVRDRLPVDFFTTEDQFSRLVGSIDVSSQSYRLQSRKINRWGNAGGVLFRVGNAAICADGQGFNYYFSGFGLFLPDSGTVEEGPVHELLCVSKLLDETFGGVSFTTGLTLPYHPLTVALALLTSTSSDTELIDTLVPDVAGPAFALDLSRYVDTVAWRDLIDATPEVEIDQIYIGWDASEVIFDTIIEKLLRPFGFYLAITDDGRIGVARLRSADVRDYCDAAGNGIELLSPARGGRLVFQTAMASAINEASIAVGGTPWSAAYPLNVRINGTSRRTGRLNEGAAWSFDLSAIARERALDYGGGSSDTTANALLNNAVLGSLGLPRLLVSAPDGRLTGMNYDLGKLVFISAGAPRDPWFIGPDGVRYVLPSEDEGVTLTFAGTIIGRGFNLETHTYDLTLLLLAYRTQSLARLRAPSMRILAWDTDVTLTGPVVPDFDDPSAPPDAMMFTEGDQVQIVNSDGTPFEAGVGVIAGTPASESIEFDVYPWMADPVSTTAPRYLRLAPSSAYSNDMLVPCFDRPWTFLGDEIGRINTTVAALVQGDRYG